MVVIAKSALKTFIKSYPDAEQALESWYEITKQNEWKNFNEMRKSINVLTRLGMTVMSSILKGITIV
jgi:mRNA-degrading endonuclease HigB of HigAB toxin-antitoxin module